MINEESLKLAERIKTARIEQNLTLRQAAYAAGVSPATIQKIETGRLIPSIEVFKKVARGLRRRASYFLGEEDGAVDLRLVRGSGARKLATDSKIRVAAIAEPLRGNGMEAYRLEIPAGVSSGKHPQYRGELLFICTKGTIEFSIRGRRELLKFGDTLHLKASIPFVWRNTSAKPAEMLQVWSPSPS